MQNIIQFYQKNVSHKNWLERLKEPCCQENKKKADNNNNLHHAWYQAEARVNIVKLPYCA